MLSLVGSFLGTRGQRITFCHTTPPILVVRLHLQVTRAQSDPTNVRWLWKPFCHPWRKISLCNILHLKGRMSAQELNRMHQNHQNLSSESHPKTRHPKPLPPGTPPWATQKLKDKTAVEAVLRFKHIET